MKTVPITLAACLLAGTASAAAYGPYAEQTYATCGSPKSRVAAVLVHGGWDMVTTVATNPAAAELCVALGRRGVYVMSIDYRLTTTPGYGWPAQWQDAQLAIRFLRSQKYPHVGIVGLSAGGYNALGVLFAQGPITWPSVDPKGESAALPDQSSAPDFAVAVSPFSNLAAVRYDQAVTNLIAGIGPALDRNTAAALASPISHIRAGTAPLMVVHGRRDPTIDISQSIALKAEMDLIGAPMQLVQTGGGHVWKDLPAASKANVFRRIGDFILANSK